MAEAPSAGPTRLTSIWPRARPPVVIVPALSRRLMILLACLSCGCGASNGSAPTAPTPIPGAPAGVAASFSIQFLLAAPGSNFTYTEPIACAPAVTSNCDSGTRPAFSAPITTTTTTRNFTLPPGRYQIIGTLRPDPVVGIGVLGFFFSSIDRVSGISPTQNPQFSAAANDAPSPTASSQSQTCGGSVTTTAVRGYADWVATFVVVTGQTFVC